MNVKLSRDMAKILAAKRANFAAAQKSGEAARPLRIFLAGIFVHFAPRFFAVFRDNFTFMRYNV